MKKFLFVLVILFGLLGMNNVIFAKEEYTNLKDPKNDDGKQDELIINRSDYTYLKSDTEDFNGMDFENFILGCRGEDYLIIEGGDKGYALTGMGDFVANKEVGEYSKVEHKGIKQENYSKTKVGWSFTCRDEECPKCGQSWSENRYKAYTKKTFEEVIKPYTDPSWCSHASGSYNNFVSRYEKEKIRDSLTTKVEYYVYGGMPVNIPAFTLVTSINPGNKDLWVAVFSADTKLKLYNAGVFQLFDSTSPHIKHTATPLTDAESKLRDTVEIFEDVEKESLEGKMYYKATKLNNSIYQYFLTCNECSTCERCIEGEYGKINAYATYGEIPEFYISRGCPLHACCFVYDYPIVLPDEFEGIKCPDLKIEGDKYPACKAHTCKRWLEHSDYRENFAPQTCLKVISGRVITGAGSGLKEIRYTGPVDEGLISLDEGSSFIVTEGGYSDYCANHTCNAFFCNSPREDSESYASKYNKQKNSVEMPNKYCASHKSGCKVIKDYSEQPVEKNEEPNGYGETIVEQIEKDRLEGKYRFCSSTVTQTFYAFVQPDTLICEGCYELMGDNKLNYKSATKNFDIGICPNCGDSGINIFDGFNGKWCATCIDFHKYKVVHRNINNYDYTDVQGTQRDKKCEFNVQRFSGDYAALCGERCVEGKRYCYWHLCDKDECSNPVRYSGSYFCKECVPYIDSGASSVLGQYVPPVSDNKTDEEHEQEVEEDVKEEIKDIPEYSQITPNALRELINSGSGINYKYKGKTISLTNRQALILLNKIDGECSYTPELATAVAQTLLNNHVYLNKSMEVVLTGNTSYAPTITTKGYSNNAVTALANIINNNSMSKEVSDIIGNSVLFAGNIDEPTNYNNAMASYVDKGLAFLTEGTVLGNPPGAITVFGLEGAYPAKCGNCNKYVPVDGRCSCRN